MSVRRFRSLLYGLQPKGALHRALHPNDWYWTSEAELQAATVETIDGLTRTFVAAMTALSGNKPKPMKPLHIPRPYDKKPDKKGTTLGELMAMKRR